MDANQTTAAVQKIKRRKKRFRSRSNEKSASTPDILETSHSVPNIENQEHVLSHHMTMSVPTSTGQRGVVTPMTKKVDPSPLSQPTATKTVNIPSRKEDANVQLLQRQLVKLKEEAENSAAEMREKLEGLQKEVDRQKEQAEGYETVSLSPLANDL